MKKTKNIQSEQQETVNYTIRDLNMSEIIPNVFDDFIVTIYEDHHTIVLPPHITGVQFKAWSRTRGGIFSKDVLNYSQNKNSAKYILFKGESINCIIRLIDEEELLTFKTLKLVDGQLKDLPYMILRNLKEGDKLTNVYKFLNEIDANHEVEVILSNSEKPTQDDDLDYHVGSISLFTE